MNRYIELKNDKSPVSNFDTFHTSTDKLENAGIILTNNIVVVDFDTHSHIALEILENVKTKAIKTERGYHLYFKIPKNIKITNSTKITTVFGNKVDYKTGNNNKKAYAIVKLNGVDREIINEEITDYPYLPLLLYPTKTEIELYNLKEGARNDSLYKHILNILDVVNDKNKVLAIANYINNNFEEPLDLKEVENIINSAFNHRYSNENVYDTDSKGGKKLNIFRLSLLLEDELNITRYKNTLYFKINDFHYTANHFELFRYIRNKGINLKQKEDNELLHQMSKTNNIILDDNLPIVLKNGFSILDGEIIESNGGFSPYYLDVNYDPSAYDENVDNFLNWFCCNDFELRLLIEEIIGHIFMGGNKPQISNFFWGAKGKNGKSTFFNMIFNLVGDLGESLALEELQKIEYISKLVGKLVNCGDDIEDGIIPQSRTFKNLTSGNRLMIREYYKAPVSFNNKATLIFSCNSIPKFKDKSGGLERRINIFPCNNKVSKIDRQIDKKLSSDEAKSYLINLALKGIKRISERGDTMIVPKVCRDLTIEYITDSDIVRQFLEFRENQKMSINGQIDSKVYMSFKLFCEDEGVMPYSKNKFTRRLKDFNYDLILRDINGKQCKIYVKVEGDNL